MTRTAEQRKLDDRARAYGTFTALSADHSSDGAASRSGAPLDKQATASSPQKREQEHHQAPCKPSLWRRLRFQYFDALLETPALVFDRERSVHSQLEAQYQSAHVAAELRRLYSRERKSLARAILAMERRHLLIGGAIALAHTLVAASIPYLLLSTLTHVLRDGPDASTTWCHLLLLGLSFSFETLCARHEAFAGQKSMVRVVSALQALVFERAIAMPVRHHERVPDIVHLIDNRAVLLGHAIGSVHRVWSRIAMLSVELYVLVRVTELRFTVVAAALAGVSTALWLATLVAAQAHQRWIAAHNDVIATVHECLRSIRTVKISASERKVQRKVERQCEAQDRLHLLRDIAAALEDAPFAHAAELLSVVVLGAMAARYSSAFTPAGVFTALVLLHRSTTRLFAIAQLSAMYLRLPAAVHAIEAFTQTKDGQAPVASTAAGNESLAAAQDASTVVSITRGCFTRGPSTQLLLVDVNVAVALGQLVVVHGKSGTGKSTLLRSLVGDATPVSGAVFVQRGRTVAYCAQEPWLQTLSVRDNVLFGSPFDARKYASVLDACCLLQDLASLPRGDRTKVGPKGVNLSGGQKARIALARACYADADVYLLDAPFASVDAIVQTDVFRKCVVELLQRKTVVLATHNPEVIRSPFVDQVVECTGMSVVVSHASSTARVSRRVEAAAPAAPWKRPTVAAEASKRSTEPSSTELSLWSLDARSSAFMQRVDAAAATATASASSRLDASELGSYDTLCAIFWRRDVLSKVLLAALAVVCGALLGAAKDLWLVQWSSSDLSDRRDASPSGMNSATVYGVLVLASVASHVVSHVCTSIALHRVSGRLFRAMTHALLHAPMAFFYTTPLGEIMYRYFIDMIAIDETETLAGLLISTASLASRVGVIAYLVGPVGLCAALIVVSAALVRIYPHRMYVRLRQADLSDQWQNLDFMFEALDGASTVRAFGPAHVARFRLQSGAYHDTSSASALFDRRFDHFVAIRASPLVGVLLLLLVGCVLTAHSRVSPAALGLLLYSSIAIARDVDDCARAYASTLLGLMYASRVRAYGALEPEDATTTLVDAAHVPAQWPSRGDVVFDHVTFRYGAGAAAALDDVSCTIAGGQRIGVVGRTGSGKSSLAMALCRLHPLASGRILIDGLDTRAVDLHVLRSRITIIPEMPTFYRGSVRQYLDPFSELDDGALWQAIRTCGLETAIASLDHELWDNGANWSVGERQVLCLARALLQPARILVLDEAFSGLDSAYAATLLAAIERAFAHSTVFLVSHRLDQLLHFDKIMVLQSGKLVEFGTALELARDPQSAFYEFLETTLLSD